MSNKYIQIVGDSTIESTGGDGVIGDEQTRTGSMGGDGTLTIQANNTDSNHTSILISESKLSARGGNGGKGYQYGDGGDGGAGKLNLISKAGGVNDIINLDRCTEIGAHGGRGGQSGGGDTFDGDIGEAPVFIECNRLYVDKYKEPYKHYWFSGAKSTTFISETSPFPNIKIKTKNDAFLYFPFIQSNTPNQAYSILTPNDANSIINVYNVLKLNILDNTDTELPDATITIYESTTIVGNGISNDLGYDLFLLLGYKLTTANKNKEPVKYSAKATLNNANGENPSFVVDNRVTSVDINITLVSIFITEVEIGGKTYTPINGMDVAGIIIIRGTAEPSGLGDIESVTIDVYRNNELIISNQATDKATNGKAYSSWSFEIDARDTAFFKNNDILLVHAIATDGTFQNDVELNLKIKHDIIPRAPVVIVINPKNDDIIDDSSAGSITISGTAYDEDRSSTTQIESSVIDEVIINIKNSTGSSVFIEPIKLTAIQGLKYIENNQSYEWTYSWKSREWSSDKLFRFPEGTYSIHVTAKDKTKLTSAERIVTIELVHSGIPPTEPPTAIVKSINPSDNGAKSGQKFESWSDTVIYYFKSEKGNHEIKLKIDLSESYDYDGNPNDPDYLRYFASEKSKASSAQWQQSPIVEISIFESEFVEKKYQLIVKVKDKWNMENKNLLVYDEKTGSVITVLNITLNIEFREEDPPYQTPLAGIISIDLHYIEIHILFIIILIVFDIVAASMIMSKFKKINKRRRAREYALDVAKQKQEEDEKKKKEDIYSHIQFVEDETKTTGRVEVAGASALTPKQIQEFSQPTVDELTKPAEPEAPKLVSMEQPEYESVFEETAPGTSEVQDETTTTTSMAESTASAASPMEVEVRPVAQAIQHIEPEAPTPEPEPEPEPAQPEETINCPICNGPLFIGQSPCPGCGTELDW